MINLKILVPIVTAIIGYILGNIYIYQDVKNLIFGHKAPAEIRGIWNTHDGSVTFIDVSDSSIKWRYLTQKGAYDHNFVGHWNGSAENGQIVGTMIRKQTSTPDGTPCILKYAVTMAYQPSNNSLGIKLDPEVPEGTTKCGVGGYEEHDSWKRQQPKVH